MQCYKSRHVQEVCCECGELALITHTRIVTVRGRGRFAYTCSVHCPLCSRAEQSIEQAVGQSQPARRLELVA